MTAWRHISLAQHSTAQHSTAQHSAVCAHRMKGETQCTQSLPTCQSSCWQLPVDTLGQTRWAMGKVEALHSTVLYTVQAFEYYTNSTK